jgi:hypothetical protein
LVKHGTLSKFHVYEMLRCKEERVRRAAFTLLEASNPKLRKDSQTFVEIARFIWDANPSYDLYLEFSKRHLYRTPPKPIETNVRSNSVTKNVDVLPLTGRPKRSKLRPWKYSISPWCKLSRIISRRSRHSIP